jgi:16S rRNA processing protein RimM
VVRLLRPQGRRGELLAEPLTDLTEIFVAGRLLWPASSFQEDAEPAAGAAPLRVESCWRPAGRNAGRIVLKLAEIDSIDAAAGLAGLPLLLQADAMPELAADTYFVRDLLGATLWNGAATVGEIVDVEFAMGADGRTRLEDAAPLLVVRLRPQTLGAQHGTEREPEVGEEQPTALVPFLRAWIVDMDIPARRITMHLPPGLIDEEEPG